MNESYFISTFLELREKGREKRCIETRMQQSARTGKNALWLYRSTKSDLFRSPRLWMEHESRLNNCKLPLHGKIRKYTYAQKTDLKEEKQIFYFFLANHFPFTPAPLSSFLKPIDSNTFMLRCTLLTRIWKSLRRSSNRTSSTYYYPYVTFFGNFNTTIHGREFLLILLHSSNN